MRVRDRRVCGSLLFLLLLSGPLWHPPAWATRVRSRAEAVRIAAEYIGLRKYAPREVRVTRVVPRDDRTPFLRTQVSGRECYRVEFHNLQIRMPWGNGKEEVVSAIHGLNALIDARTGKLLRVWSAERLASPPARYAAAEVEKRMRSSTGERWVGFPDTRPRVPLLMLLYNRENRFASQMEQLDAYYVKSVSDNPQEASPHMGWHIFLRQTRSWGGPPEQSGPHPIYGWRSAFDWKTGKCFVDESW